MLRIIVVAEDFGVFEVLVAISASEQFFPGDKNFFRDSFFWGAVLMKTLCCEVHTHEHDNVGK